LEDVGAWRRLKAAYGNEPIFQRLSEALRSREFSATLYHGDFAPWNIKVSGDKWTALDWERGELTGVPGWDWFHYVTQSGILVKKLSAGKLMTKLEQLMEAKIFRDYAERAGIAGYEKNLAVAYLFYCAKELRPTEGADTGAALLALSAERWLK
jgi:aminoglycoside phosphotransferase (APT) family kinase protein